MKAFVYGTDGAAIIDVAKPSPTGTQVLIACAPAASTAPTSA